MGLPLSLVMTLTMRMTMKMVMTMVITMAMEITMVMIVVMTTAMTKRMAMPMVMVKTMVMTMVMTMVLVMTMPMIMTITWIVQEQIATDAIKNKKIITEDKVDIHIPSSAVENMDRFNLTRIRDYFDTDAWTALEANLMSKKRSFTL